MTMSVAVREPCDSLALDFAAGMEVIPRAYRSGELTYSVITAVRAVAPAARACRRVVYSALERTFLWQAQSMLR